MGFSCQTDGLLHLKLVSRTLGFVSQLVSQMQSALIENLDSAYDEIASDQSMRIRA